MTSLVKTMYSGKVRRRRIKFIPVSEKLEKGDGSNHLLASAVASRLLLELPKKKKKRKKEKKTAIHLKLPES